MELCLVRWVKCVTGLAMITISLPVLFMELVTQQMDTSMFCSIIAGDQQRACMHQLSSLNDWLLNRLYQHLPWTELTAICVSIFSNLKAWSHWILYIWSGRLYAVRRHSSQALSSEGMDLFFGNCCGCVLEWPASWLLIEILFTIIIVISIQFVLFLSQITFALWMC